MKKKVVMVISSILWFISQWNGQDTQKNKQTLDCTWFVQGELIGWLWFAIGRSHVSDRFVPPSCR